jgi:hypothetical protein
LVYALKEKMFEIVWKLTKPGLRTDDFYSVFVAVNVIENPFRTRPTCMAPLPAEKSKPWHKNVLPSVSKGAFLFQDI